MIASFQTICLLGENLPVDRGLLLESHCLYYNIPECYLLFSERANISIDA